MRAIAVNFLICIVVFFGGAVLTGYASIIGAIGFLLMALLSLWLAVMMWLQYDIAPILHKKLRPHLPWTRNKKK